MLRSLLIFLTAMLLSLALTHSGIAHRKSDLSGALASDVSHLKLKQADWQTLNAGQIVTRALPGSQTKEMAAFGALLVEASTAEICQTFQSLTVFEQSDATLACERFSTPPVESDLAKLTIGDKDLYGLMHARAQAASIKLSAADILRLNQAAGVQPLFTTKLKARLATEFKQLLLGKARTYAEQGAAALDGYADQAESVQARDALDALLRFQLSQAGHPLPLAAELARAPRETDSLLYWALQTFGKLKPVISMVHLQTYRDGPRIFLLARQIYASHYTEAALSVAELIPFTDSQGQPCTLVAYTIRLQVDLLGGSLGFLKKRAAQPQMLDTLKQSLQRLRLMVETARDARVARQAW